MKVERPGYRPSRYCYHPYFNWLLPAWIFYFLGAVGYVVLDLSFAVHVNWSDYTYAVLYMVLAVIYFVDSIFYFLAWIVQAQERRDFEGEPILFDAAAWGEILYIFSAMFGVMAAGCQFMVPTDRGSIGVRLTSAVAGILAFGSMQFCSNVLYLVDSFCYWSAWYNKRVLTNGKGNPLLDAYFWADGIILTIPSAGYFATSFGFLFTLVVALKNVDTIGDLITQYETALLSIRAANVIFDAFYVADAVVYFVGWVQDSYIIREERIRRGQESSEGSTHSSDEIDLGVSFDIYPPDKPPPPRLRHDEEEEEEEEAHKNHQPTIIRAGPV